MLLLPFSALNCPPPSLFVRYRTIRAGSPKHEALNLSVFRLGDFSIWANPPHNPRDPLDVLELAASRPTRRQKQPQSVFRTVCRYKQQAMPGIMLLITEVPKLTPKLLFCSGSVVNPNKPGDWTRHLSFQDRLDDVKDGARHLQL